MKNLGGLALIGLVIVTGYSILAFGVHKAQTAADQAHKALCTVYIGDLRQAQDTIDYLKTHPNGAPSLGLSRAALLRGVERAKTDAKAENPGGCDDIPARLQQIAREVG